MESWKGDVWMKSYLQRLSLKHTHTQAHMQGGGEALSLYLGASPVSTYLPQSNIKRWEQEKRKERRKKLQEGRTNSRRCERTRELMRERESKREEEVSGTFSPLKTRDQCSLSFQWHRRLRRESTGTKHWATVSLSLTPASLALLQVITPFRRLILCAENRKEMEDWISSLKSVQSREHYEVRGRNLVFV